MQSVTLNNGLLTIAEKISKVPSKCFTRSCKILYIVLNDVEEIEGQAFEYCAALQHVHGNKVKQIRRYAFSTCFSLYSIDCPLLEHIGYTAFY